MRGSSSDVVVGGGWMEGAEPEQGLEGGHRGAAAVVAEDELVEVDLEVALLDASVGALQPGLEVRARAMRARQELLFVGKAAALLDRAVVVAQLGQALVAGPAIGVYDRAGRDVGGNEA